MSIHKYEESFFEIPFSQLNASDFDDVRKSDTFPSPPNKKDFTLYYFYAQGKVLGSSKNSREFFDCVSDSVFDTDSYKAARALYQEADRRLRDYFKAWALDMAGVSQDHPKAEMLYEMGLEQSASGSFQSIAESIDNLSQLVI